MEGCPISVTATFTMPDQPAAGTLDRIPLGGDGFTAPLAAYSIQGNRGTGDAGGGALFVQAIMDQRFVSLVAYATLQLQQATPGDVDIRMSIGGLRQPAQLLQEPIVATSSTMSAQTITKTWTPTPYLLPGGGVQPDLLFTVANVLADVLSMDALIYLFDIRVRELTPTGPLLWARGST